MQTQELLKFYVLSQKIPASQYEAGIFIGGEVITIYSTSFNASRFSSPVRTFTTLSTLYTKILPSPICPV